MCLHPNDKSAGITEIGTDIGGYKNAYWCPYMPATVVLGFLDLETSVQEGDRLLNFCVTVVSSEVDTLTTVRFEIVPGSGTASKCNESLTIAQDYLYVNTIDVSANARPHQLFWVDYWKAADYLEG